MRIVFVMVLLAFCFSGMAQDIKLVNQTQAGFIGAINGILGDPLDTVQYIPGYGLSYTAKNGFSGPTIYEAAARLRPVFALVLTIRGLALGDWVSVAYRDSDGNELVIRAKQVNPIVIEAWFNGKNQ